MQAFVVQRQAVEYAGVHNGSPTNPYGAYRPAAPVAKRRKVPKNYVEMGRMNYISLTQGSVLHPFGQDDWISRSVHACMANLTCTHELAH